MKHLIWVLVAAFLIPTLALAQDPPTAFDMSSPADGATLHTGDVILDWSTSTDPNGGAISYTVEVAEDAGFTVNLQTFVTSSSSLLFDGLSDGDSFFWRVTATDSEPLSTPSTTADFEFDVNLNVRDFVRGFSLWAPGVVPDVADAETNLGDDINGLFVVYSFSNATGYQIADEIEHGHAYWLAIAFDEESTVDIDGAAYDEDEFELDLDQAWNFIGYPYQDAGSILDWSVTNSDDVTLPLADAAAENWLIPTIHRSWAHTNQYPIPFDAKTVVRPWDGFWMLTRDAGLTLTIPNPDLVPAPPVPAVVQSADPSGWEIHPVISLDDVPQTAVQIGANSGASLGFDPMYDVPRSPEGPEPASVKAYFDQPDWLPTVDNRFIADVRAPFEAGQNKTWEIVVEGTGAMTLTIPDLLNGLPTEYSVSITDLLTNTTFDPAQLTAYQFDSARSFRIVVTAGANAVDGPVSAQPISFEVLPAYPNPFNPAVTVPFSLPAAGEVTVNLVNPLGRTVRSLTQAYGAGSHVMTVNGATLPTGMYFLTVQGQMGQHTQKVMLLK